MYRFNREKILPEFLKRQMTFQELALEAGVSPSAVSRAINGKTVRPLIVSKVAAALKIDPLKYLEGGNETKRTP